MRGILYAAALACTVSASSALVTAARATAPASTARKPVVMASIAALPAKPSLAITKSASMDKSPNMLYATGEGAMASAKEQPNRAKAYLQAKAYAKMDAIAGLVQAAKGTIVNYRSNGHGYIAETSIKAEIKGILECVQVVSAKKRAEGKDTIVEVTVRAPKPAPPKEPAVEKTQPKEQPKPPAVAKPRLPSWVNDPGRENVASGYTSVVIDAGGLRVARSMSPKILRRDGSEVWGTVRVDPDFLCDYGIASYARSRSEALANRRAGANPLVVRAVSRARSASGTDIVISDQDADRLLSEDSRSGFLSEFRVVIVVD